MLATYSYKCKTCNDKFDRMVQKSQANNQKCYKCGESLMKLMSATPTTFKFNDK